MFISEQDKNRILPTSGGKLIEVIGNKKSHWTPEDDRKLREMLPFSTFIQIAKALKRSENAVKLYIHRERIPVNPKVKKNLLIELLTIRFINPEFFMPNRKFYNETGINQNRWWKLYRGDDKITEDEYIRLVDYFGIKHEIAFEKRQLEIFQ